MASQPATGDDNQISPQEQDQYNQFVGQALNLTYSDQMQPQIVDMLRGAEDPVSSLANTSATVIGRVANAAERTEERLSGDVVMSAGTEVFEDLANPATKAGIHDFESDPDSMEAPCL